MQAVTDLGARLGIAASCAALGLPKATYYRALKPRPPRAKRSSHRALGAAERRAVLVRIYNKLAHEAGADGKQRSLADLDELIDRVVNESWTIRRLERYARDLVDAGAHPKTARRAGSNRARPAEPVLELPVPAPTPAAIVSTAPFRRVDNGVFIDTGRIARRQVSPEEREELIKILEELLMAVRRV